MDTKMLLNMYLHDQLRYVFNNIFMSIFANQTTLDLEKMLKECARESLKLKSLKETIESV